MRKRNCLMAYILIVILIFVSGCSVSTNTQDMIVPIATGNAESGAVSDGTEENAPLTPLPERAVVPSVTVVPDQKKTENTREVQYIGNKNTKKFHYPYCGSVGQMKDKNKDYLYGSRDEAITKGYSPCGNCKP